MINQFYTPVLNSSFTRCQKIYHRQSVLKGAKAETVDSGGVSGLLGALKGQLRSQITALAPLDVERVYDTENGI